MIRATALAVAMALLATTAGAAGADERGYDLRNQEARRPAPLLVMLHCYGCPPRFLPAQLGIDAVAKRHGALVAVPAGLTDSQGAPFWNATPACCDFEGARPDDVAYVARVIDDAVKKHGADPRRVYLVGFSNGGFLAYRLACELAPKIAAIVSIGGAGPEPGSCKPSGPVAVLEIHGEADEVVPVAGGPLAPGLRMPRHPLVPPASATLAGWARVDGCDARGAGRWHCTRAAVEQWTFPGIGHVASFAPDAGERIWQWLAAQRK